MTLMKERSEFALPLLERAVAADRLIACDTNAGRDVDLVFYLAHCMFTASLPTMCIR